MAISRQYRLSIERFSRQPSPTKVKADLDHGRVTKQPADIKAKVSYRRGTLVIDGSGVVADYGRRRGIVCGLVFPPGVELPEGWETLSQHAISDWFWSQVYERETRANAFWARDFELNIPYELMELDPALGYALIDELATHFASKYRFVVDFAIHPPPGRGRDSRFYGDHRNWHAHAVVSARQVEAITEDGEVVWVPGNKPRVLDDPSEVRAVREVFARLTNKALADADIRDADGELLQVSHLSLEAQGIDEKPQRHMGKAATAIERKLQRQLAAFEDQQRNTIVLLGENAAQIIMAVDQGLDQTIVIDIDQPAVAPEPVPVETDTMPSPEATGVKPKPRTDVQTGVPHPHASPVGHWRRAHERLGRLVAGTWVGGPIVSRGAATGTFAGYGASPGRAPHGAPAPAPVVTIAVAPSLDVVIIETKRPAQPPAASPPPAEIAPPPAPAAVTLGIGPAYGHMHLEVIYSVAAGRRFGWIGKIEEGPHRGPQSRLAKGGTAIERDISSLESRIAAHDTAQAKVESKADDAATEKTKKSAARKAKAEAKRQANAEQSARKNAAGRELMAQGRTGRGRPSKIDFGASASRSAASRDDRKRSARTQDEEGTKDPEGGHLTKEQMRNLERAMAATVRSRTRAGRSSGKARGKGKGR